MITLKTPAAIEALSEAIQAAAKAGAQDADAISKRAMELYERDQAGKKPDGDDPDEDAFCKVTADFIDALSAGEAIVAEYHVQSAYARRDWMEALGFQVKN